MCGEVRSGNGAEWHPPLARNRARKQGLAGAGAADQQRALGYLPTQLGEAVRVLEEFDDFLQLLARLVDPGDIGKGDAALSLGQQLGLALAEAHGPAAAALDRKSTRLNSSH